MEVNILTVHELEEYLKTVTNKNKEVFFYIYHDNPFTEYMSIDNAFEVSGDANSIGDFEGVYLRGN